MKTGAVRETVYVVDADQRVRNTLRWILRAAGFRVEVYATAEHFLDVYEPRCSSCLVVEVQMPGMSGLDLQDELVRRREYLPIVFVTSQGDVRTAVRAMKRGAVDFLEKPCDRESLLGAVREALRHTAHDLERGVSQVAIADRLASLSPREHDVLACVVDGNTNKAIAGKLGISVKTVECHRARIMEKVGARSVAELVRLVTVAAQTAVTKALFGSGHVPVTAVAVSDVRPRILTGS
jgi:FixJ family two-component response regulator